MVLWKSYADKSRARNRERIREQQKDWRQRDPERARAVSREKARRFRIAHGEELRADERRRYREDPVYRARKDAAEARRRGAMAGTRIKRDVVLELAAGLCGICGDLVDPEDFHVDHRVPLCQGGEHSYENTQPAHPACNWAKGGRG